MQFTVSKTDLARELALLAGAVARKVTIPILSQFCLEAKGGSLEIRATDLEIALQASCPAKVKVEGALCAPAAKLTAIVKSLPEGELQFHLKDGRLTLKSGRSTFSLMTMSDQNFPALPESPAVIATLPGSLLRSLIERVRFAISTAESRYTMNGALFSKQDGDIRMVATDGHRLSVVECLDHESIPSPASSGSSAPLETIFPVNALAALLPLIGTAPLGSVVDFGQDKNHLFFTVGSRRLTARKISGQFPNWPGVLPKDNPLTFEVDAQALTAALDRVLLLSDARTNMVRLHAGNGQLLVACNSAESGSAEDSIATEYAGTPLEIGFNGLFLLDFLKTAGTEKVRLSLKDEQAAGEFAPVFVQDPEDKTSLSQRYVVMPMRI